MKEGQSLITTASVDVADEELIEMDGELSNRGSRSYRVEGVILLMLVETSRVVVVECWSLL